MESADNDVGEPAPNDDPDYCAVDCTGDAATGTATREAREGGELKRSAPARPEPDLRRAPLGLHAVRRRTREPGVGLHRRPALARSSVGDS